MAPSPRRRVCAGRALEWRHGSPCIPMEVRITLSLYIVPVVRDRERYRDLLLLADEQWGMVERYLHRGEIFIAFERGDCACASPAAPCFASAGEDDPDVSVRPEEALGCMVVTDEGFDERGHRVAEVKSLAVLPASRCRSAGRALLDFAAARYSSTHDVCRLERVTALSSCHLTRHAALCGRICCPTSSSTTTTIRFLKPGFSPGAWCICKKSCRGLRAARYQLDGSIRKTRGVSSRSTRPPEVLSGWAVIVWSMRSGPEEFFGHTSEERI